MNVDSRTPERLLLIGYNGFAGIDAVTWNEQRLPNIPDYDLIVVSVPHITKAFLQKVDAQFFNNMKESLAKFLYSKGKLIILLSQVLQVSREKTYPSRVTSLDWCPVSFNTQEEAGRSIVYRSGAYKDYLAKMQDWSFCITVSNSLSKELIDCYGPMRNTQYSCKQNPYLENRYERIIAGEYVIEVRMQKRKEAPYVRGRVFYSIEPDYLSGLIVVLPLINGVTPEEALLDILKEEIGYSQESPFPAWAQEVEVPGVSAIEEKLTLAKATIEKKKKTIQKLERRIQQLTAFRRLLFGSGTELEDIVKKSFEFCDIPVKPAQYAQEEYILAVDGQECLMEVKGVSKSITLTHLRQLTDYLLKYQEATGKVCKGILLGNAWRNKPPNLRNKGKTPEFPDNVVKRAEQLGIALVSSRTLFNVIAKVLNGKAKGPELIDALISANGIAQLKEEQD